jgi:hypothetical protein
MHSWCFRITHVQQLWDRHPGPILPCAALALNSWCTSVHYVLLIRWHQLSSGLLSFGSAAGTHCHYSAGTQPCAPYCCAVPHPLKCGPVSCVSQVLFPSRSCCTLCSPQGATLPFPCTECLLPLCGQCVASPPKAHSCAEKHLPCPLHAPVGHHPASARANWGT